MIGIVVLNYNNYMVTERCIESILSFPPKEKYRIYIVDNGSTNDSYTILSKRFINEVISVHFIKENVGFAKGNEYGISLCEKDQMKECILANSDILFCEGSIDAITRLLREHDDAVIVGPKVINGITQNQVMHSSRLKKGSILDPLGLGRIIPTKKLDEENEKGCHKVWSVSGCCFGINIERFRKMNGFDTNTFLYNEENIMGMQAESAGLSIYINLDTYVIHEHGASSGKDSDFIRTEYIKSTLYYWKTYRRVPKSTLHLILFAYCCKLRVKRIKELHPDLINQAGIQYINTLYQNK